MHFERLSPTDLILLRTLSDSAPQVVRYARRALRYGHMGRVHASPVFNGLSVRPLARTVLSVRTRLTVLLASAARQVKCNRSLHREMQMATSQGKVEAGLAETAASQALAIEAEAEDKSRVADVKVARAASLVGKYQTTLALRLR